MVSIGKQQRSSGVDGKRLQLTTVFLFSLNSSSSKEICDTLLQVARRAGMTVVAVIHSPRYEIFEMFDDVLMLGK